MMVRNWMQANPMTIPSDTLVSDAKRLLSEHNLLAHHHDSFSCDDLT